MIPNLNDLLQSASGDQKPELFAIKRATKINSIQEKDPMDCFEVTNSNAKAIYNETEQRRDTVIRKVITRIENGCNDDLKYASVELR